MLPPTGAQGRSTYARHHTREQYITLYSQIRLLANYLCNELVVSGKDELDWIGLDLLAGIVSPRL